MAADVAGVCAEHLGSAGVQALFGNFVWDSRRAETSGQDGNAIDQGEIAKYRGVANDHHGTGVLRRLAMSEVTSSKVGTGQA
jgi:hypothetical protein